MVLLDANKERAPDDQSRGRPMRKHDVRAAKRSQGEPLEGIERMELVCWRFSAAEIQSLSLLQLKQRYWPNALDLPLNEGRLQFAHWLVEHGLLSEHMGGDLEAQPEAETASDALWRQGIAPTPCGAVSMDASVGASVRESRMERARRMGHEHWRPLLLRAWSITRRGLATLGTIGRELESTDCLFSCEGRFWKLYRADEFFWPRDPHSPHDR